MDSQNKIDALRQAVHAIDTLPATPAIADRVISMPMNTEESMSQLLLLAEQDPMISARLIGLANTQKAHSEPDILSISDCVSQMGPDRFRSVVSGLATMSLLTRGSMGHFNMHDFWLHNLGIAFSMISIAKSMPAELRPPDDQIFLAGMLHDIGFVALASADPDQSDVLYEFLAAEPGVPVTSIEYERIGITHEELGAELAKHWGLPTSLIAVIRYHHEPDSAGAQAGQPLVRMVNIAEKMIPAFAISEHVHAEINAREWEALGIDPNHAGEVRKQAAEQAEQAYQFANSFA